MSIITIILIGVGLAMDCFAVSIANGFAMTSLKIKNAMRIAFYFGLFQAVMPVLGWLAGTAFKQLISGVDHWIAFGLLFAIGIKMIIEALRLEKTERHAESLNTYTLLMLSIATSIDALAVGISLSFLQVSIIMPALLIGIVTFLLSLSGVVAGKKFGHLLESKIEIGGGLILMGIGIKILYTHLTSSI